MFSAIKLFLFSLIFSSSVFAGEFYQQDAIDFYSGRYPLKNADAKWVDNQGNGFEPLYGVRNMRVVLNGVVYRGGANNAYFKYGKRDNRNPLPDLGLKNLCQEGFSQGVYLYSTNFGSAAPQTSCQSIAGRGNTFEYSQLSPFSDSDVKKILHLVYDRIRQPEKGPMYVHCWNGWHASGLTSAYILRQFCGATADQAVAYWDRNTDGNNQGVAYDGHRLMIRKFVPMSGMEIDPSVRARICPKF